MLLMSLLKVHNCSKIIWYASHISSFMSTYLLIIALGSGSLNIFSDFLRTCSKSIQNFVVLKQSIKSSFYLKKIEIDILKEAYWEHTPNTSNEPRDVHQKFDFIFNCMHMFIWRRDIDTENFSSQGGRWKFVTCQIQISKQKSNDIAFFSQ